MGIQSLRPSTPPILTKLVLLAMKPPLLHMFRHTLSRLFHRVPRIRARSTPAAILRPAAILTSVARTRIFYIPDILHTQAPSCAPRAKSIRHRLTPAPRLVLRARPIPSPRNPQAPRHVLKAKFILHPRTQALNLALKAKSIPHRPTPVPRLVWKAPFILRQQNTQALRRVLKAKSTRHPRTQAPRLPVPRVTLILRTPPTLAPRHVPRAKVISTQH